MSNGVTVDRNHYFIGMWLGFISGLMFIVWVIGLVELYLHHTTDTVAYKRYTNGFLAGFMRAQEILSMLVIAILAVAAGYALILALALSVT